MFLNVPFGLDKHPGHLPPGSVDELLDRGVDGIMTDRPSEVMPLVAAWKERHPTPTLAPEPCRPAPPDDLSQRKPDLEKRLRDHVRVLAGDIGPRSWASFGNLNRAADYIHAELRCAGYEAEKSPSYETCNPAGSGEQFHNVVATLPGETDEVVVIGAHYDTDATDECGPTPGADDNASGVAAMIELARYFQGRKLRRTLRFVAFTNEEEPFFSDAPWDMGSARDADEAIHRHADIVAMVSLESMGFYVPDAGSQSGARIGRLFGLNLPTRGDFVAFVANNQSNGEVQCAKQGFESYSRFPVETVVLSEWWPLTKIDWSDQKSFWANGFSGMMVTDTAIARNQAYHHRDDTPETLNYAAMTEVVTGMIGAVEALANAPLR